MVAIVSSPSLGLLNSSGNSLGGSSNVGPGSPGSNGEQIVINSATGNLVVQDTDETLAALGLNLALVRTYNSQGLLNGTNNDGWRIGVEELVSNLTGRVNTQGSTITKTFGDGTNVVYTYSTALGVYVGRNTGSNDTLSFSSNQWIWTDGATRSTETYNANGQLLNAKDQDGNTVKYAYTGTLLTSIADASGQQTYLDYTGNNLTQIRVVSAGKTETLTRYAYDSSNRLKTVTVDLSPQDNSIADGNTYVTTYSYQGSSDLISNITQTDGSSVSFTYQNVNGQYRVQTYTVNDAVGGNRPTTFSYSQYSAGGAVYQQCDVTDPLNRVTTYKQDANGRLTSILSPAVSGARLETDYTYDSAGKVLTVTQDPAGLKRVTTYQYDTNENLTLTRDAAGDTTTYTYDAANQVVTQTQYLTPDPDGAGPKQPSSPITTRYVYDANENLRFEISADGRVTEYRYTAQGQLQTSLSYSGASYAVSALAPTATLSLSTMQTWASSQNLTQLQRTDYTYDFRSQVSSITTWSTTGSTGAGVAGKSSVTRMIYDQRGNLLQTITPLGTSTPDGVTTTLTDSTTYTYDGLGRQLTETQWLASGVTRTATTQYDDADNRTITRAANGLITTSTYDHAGELTSVVNTGPGSVALGTTTYKYDADSRLLMTTDPTGVNQYAVYDAAGRKTGEVDGNGAVTEFVYDNVGELIKTIAYATPLGTTAMAALVSSTGTPLNPAIAAIRPATSASDQTTRAIYNSAGELSVTIDAAGDVAQMSYDGEGRLIAQTQLATPLSIASTVGELRLTATSGQLIDPATNKTYTIATSAQDRLTRYFYNNDGELTGTLDSAGYLTENIYDSVGEVIQTIAYANVTASNLWLTGSLAQLRPALDSAHDQNTYYFYDGDGREAGVLDADGYLTATQYDAAGDVLQTTRTDAVLSYSSTSTLASLQASIPASAVQHTTSYQYDGDGRVIQETNYEGTITTYVYDSADDLISSTVAQGTSDTRTTQARYDALGRVTQALTAQGSAALSQLLASNPSATQAQIDAVWAQYSVHSNYDADGRLVSQTDQNNLTTTYYYDNDGQVRFTVNAEGEVTETRYNALNQVTSTLSYTNRISTTGLTGGLLTTALTTQLTPVLDAVHDAKTTYTYTLTGQVATQVTAMGASIASQYDAFGDEKVRLEKIDATHTLEQDFVYDNRGLLTSEVSDPAGLKISTSSKYDAFGRAYQTTDARGNLSTYSYDRLGRTITTTTALGGAQVTLQTLSYDAFDRVLTTTDALNNIAKYNYNDTTRSVTVTTPENIQVTTVHNREGQTLTVTAADNTTTYGYDANGQLQSVSDNLGTLDSRTYDAAGREIADTDGRGIVTKFGYDAANRVLTRTVDPTTIHTPNDNPNGLNLVTSYQYDGQGQVLQVTDPTNSVTQTSYDADGRVTDVAVDPTGLNLRTHYTYDLASDVLTVTEGYGSATPRTTQYLYNVLGQRTQQIVDPGTGHLNLTTQYFYDANGNATRSIDANGNSTWYVYDAENRLTDTINALGEVTEQTYDADDRVIATRQYMATVAVASFGNIVTATHPTATTVSFQSGTNAAVTLATAATDTVDQTVYDKDGRAQYSINGVGTVTERTFDANGNVTRSRTYGIAIAAGSYTTVASIQKALTAAGNSLTTVSASDRVEWTAYDLRGQVAFTVDGTGAVCQYQYDGNGNLVSTTAYATLRDTTAATDLASLQSWAAGSAIAGNAQNKTTQYWYDNANRLRFVLDADGYLRETRYNDVARQTTQILYAAKPTVAANATLAQVVSAAAAIANSGIDEATVTQTDAAGRVASVTNINLSVTTSYQYDATGNMVMSVDSLGLRHFYLYDAASRLVGEVDADGELTEYDYDNAGQVIKTVAYADLLSAATLATLVDANGNATTVSLATLKAALPATVGRASDQTTRAIYNSAGELSVTIDAAGDVAQMSYDGEGRLIAQTQLATPLSIASTVGELRLTATSGQLIDPATNKTYTIATSAQDRLTRYFYNNDGELTGTLDSAGYLTENIYDSVGEVIQTIAYANVTASNLWLTGSLAQLRPALDSAHDQNTYYFYDGDGREAGVLDADGYLTATQYDAAGDVLQTTRTDAVLSYSSTSTLASLQASIPASAVQHTTSYQYDGDGRVIQETNYEGTITTYVYDSADDLISSTVAQGTSDTRTTQARYDALGRVTQALTAQGSAALSQLLASNPSATQAQIDAVWAQYSVHSNYDADGRLVSQTDQNNLTTTYYYDNDGQVRFTVNAEGEVTETRYNALNQVTSTLSYTNRISTTGLTGGLLTTALTTQLTPVLDAVHDAKTTYTYTLTGQVATQVTAMGASIASQYDAFGDEKVRLEKIDATHTLEQDFVYDNRGLLTSEVSDPAGLKISTSSKYDAFGRAYQTTDARGNLSTYSYDRLGRTISTSDALNEQQSTTYDAFDRVMTTTDALGNTTTYAYNDASKSVMITTPEGIGILTVHNAYGQTVGVMTQTDTITYQYDANGNLIAAADMLGTLESRTYDSAGREVTGTDARGIVTKFSYDAANRVLTQTVDPTTINTANDNPNGLNLVTSYQYDGQGRVIQVTDPTNSVTQTSYDADGRVTDVAVDPTGLNLRTHYTYDLASDTLTVTTGYGSTPRTTQYVYDAEGRRTDMIVDPTSLGGTLNLHTQYKYDANGNVTRSIDANGNSTWYVYDADNRLTDTIDALGEVTEQSFDADNRVIATRQYMATVSVASFGNIVTATHPTATTVSFQSGTNAAVTLTTATTDTFTQVVYDKDGRAVYRLDGLGDVTEFTYDGNGQVTQTRAYVTPIAVGSYTTVASVQAALTAAGNDPTTPALNDHLSFNVYDARGRAIITVDGAGAVVSYQYDGDGNVVSVTALAALHGENLPSDAGSLQNWVASSANAAKDETTQYWYDSANRQRFTLDAEGYLHETLYDDVDRQQISVTYLTKPTLAANASLQEVVSALTAIANPNQDHTSMSTFDAAGRLAQVRDGEGYVTNYIYDSAGNLIETDQQLDQSSPPTFASTHYYYDAANRQIDTLSAQGYLTQTQYDAVGNVKVQTVYDQRVAVPAAGSLPVPIAGDTGHVTDYQYDADSRLTRETRELLTYARGVTSYTVKSGDTWASIATSIYGTTLLADELPAALGLTALPATGMVITPPASLTDVINTDYRYDTFGNCTDVTEAAGTADAVTTHSVYDAANRVTDTTVAYGTGDAVTTHYTFDSFGNIATRYDAYNTADQRRESFLYDGDDRVLFATQEDLIVNGDPVVTATEYDAFGNVQIQIDAYGSADMRIESYTYDRRNLKTSYTNGAGDVETYQYDAAANQTAVTNGNAAGLTTADDLTSGDSYYRDFRQRLGIVDSNGQGKLASELTAADIQLLTERSSTYFTYDRDNRLVTSTDANGVVTQTTYDGAGNTKTVTQALGVSGQQRTTYYNYDLDNRLTDIVDPMGGHTHYDLDALGDQLKMTDANGNVRSNVYDKIGRLQSSLLTGTGLTNGGILTTNTYDHRGNVLSTTQSFADGSDARTTTYQYDLRNDKTRITDGEDFSTVIAYDLRGNQTSVATGLYLVATTDPNFDSVKSILGWNGLTTTFQYNAADQVTDMIDGAGDDTHYDYDEVGNRIAVTEAYGAKDANGNALDRTTKYTYDGANRLIGVYTPVGGETLYTYDHASNQITERQLQSAQYGAQMYDASDNYVSAAQFQADFSGPQDNAVLDGNGNPVDAVWIDTSFEYDGKGQKTATIDPYGTRTEYTYDAVGNLTLTRTAAGTSDERTTGAQYDLDNRKIADLDGYQNRTSYVYDALGNRIQATDALGHVAHYYYNAANELTTVLDADNYINTFQYDSAGNKTQTRVYMDAYSGPVSNSVAPTPTSEPTDRIETDVYNRANRLVSDTAPDGTVTLTTYSGNGEKVLDTLYANTTAPRYRQYGYDAAGRLVNFTDVDLTYTTFTYDAANNQTSVTINAPNDPNPVRKTTYGYDLNNRRVGEYLTDGNNVVYSGSVTQYDLVGNVIAQATLMTPAEAGATVSSTEKQYDLNNNLVAVSDGLGYTTQFGYDKVNNRTSMTDAMNNVTNYVYDLNNRQTQQIAPSVTVHTIGATDQVSRPTTVTQYDAVGNVVQITDPSGFITTSWYDGDGRKVAELSGDDDLMTYGYDAAGEVVTQTQYMTRLQPSAHDPNTPPTPVVDTAQDRTTTYQYDLGGRLVLTTLPPVDVTTLLDTNTNEPFASDHTTVLTVKNVYDAYGDLVESYDRAGDRSVSYYDVNHRKVAAVDSEGYLIEWDYDEQGNILEQRVYTQALADPGSLTPGTRPTEPSGEVDATTYTYDVASRLLQEEQPQLSVYDPTTGLSSEMRPTTTYTYDFAGNMISKTSGAGTSQATTEYWVYDLDNRAEFYVDGNDVLTEYVYDANGNQLDRLRFYGSLPSNPILPSYANSSTIAQLQQEITTEQNYVAGQDELHTQSFDALNRLTSETDVMVASDSSQNLTKTYEYDADGNRTYLKDEDGYITQTSYDANGHVLDTILPNGTGTVSQYDAAGNLTQTYIGAVANHVLPASQVTASESGSDIDINWTMDAATPMTSWVVYDTVSRANIADYANVSLQQLSGVAGVSTALGVDIGPQPGGTPIYFRVVTQDLAGNQTWTAEQELTTPSVVPATNIQAEANSYVQPSNQAGAASVGSTGVNVSWNVSGNGTQSWVVYDTVSHANVASSTDIAGYANHTAVQSSTTGAASAALTNIPPSISTTQNADKSYSYQNVTVYFRVITEDAAGHLAWSSEQSFLVPPRLTNVVFNEDSTANNYALGTDGVAISTTVSQAANSTGYELYFSTQLPATYAANIGSLQVQWRVAGSGSAYNTQNVTAVTTPGNTTTTYNYTIGSSQPLAAGDYEIVLSCVNSTDHLNDQNALTNITQLQTFTRTVQAAASNNLVVNGDFSEGNTGFTTDYSLGDPPSETSGPTTTYGDTVYLVGSSPNSANSNYITGGDHTTGTGNMMIVNGSAAANKTVWSETVATAANTNYDFSYWLESLAHVPFATLQVSINNVVVGTINAGNPGQWSQFAATWNSGSSTSATITIVDTTAAASGNDFGLDDIFFGQSGALSTYYKGGSDTAASSGYSYQIYATGTVPSDYWQTDFNDSGFNVGSAPFAGYVPQESTSGTWPLITTPESTTLGNPIDQRAQTYWPTNTELVVRRLLNLPAGATNVVVHIAIDNDAEVYFNGDNLTGGLLTHGGQADFNEYSYAVPDSALLTSNNLLAIHARDDGGISGLDVWLTWDSNGTTSSDFWPGVSAPVAVGAADELNASAESVTARFDGEVQSAQLLYGTPGNLTTTLNLVRRPDGTYWASSADLAGAKANGLSYAIRWTDMNGNVYTTPESTFQRTNAQAISVVTSTSDSAVSSNGTTGYLMNMSLAVPTAAGFSQITVQWSSLTGDPNFTDTYTKYEPMLTVAPSSSAAGTDTYNFTIGSDSALLTADTYGFLIFGVRPDGTRESITLGRRVVGAGLGTQTNQTLMWNDTINNWDLPNYSNVGLNRATLPVTLALPNPGDSSSPGILALVRNTASPNQAISGGYIPVGIEYITGRVAISMPVLAANSSYVYDAYSEVPPGAQFNLSTINVSSSSPSANSTNLSVSVSLNPADVPTIAGNSLELWYAPIANPAAGVNEMISSSAVSVVAMPATSASIDGNWNLVTSGVYAATLTNLPAGQYQIQVRYKDLAGRTVILQNGGGGHFYLGVSTSSASASYIHYIATVITNAELGATITSDANGALSVQDGDLLIGSAENANPALLSLNLPITLTTTAGQPAILKPLTVTASNQIVGAGASSANGLSTGYFVEMTYDALNNKISSNENDGLERTFGYDANGHIVETKLIGDPSDISIPPIATYSVVDARGNVLTQFDPDMQAPDGTTQRPETHYTYDVFNRVTSKIDPNQGLWQYQYNAYGTQISAIDPLKNTTLTYVDQFGHVTGTVTPNSYDSGLAGGATFVAKQFYDSLGHLTQTIDANGVTTGYGYDLFGRLTSETDGRGMAQGAIAADFTTFYLYDNRDRRIATVQPYGYDLATSNDPLYAADRTRLNFNSDATALTQAQQLALIALYSTTYKYDGRGNLLSSTKSTGSQQQITEQTYDGLSRVVTSDISDGSNIYSYVHTVYDDYGNIFTQTDAMNYTKSFIYGAFGRLKESVDQDGNVTDYFYDTFGRQTYAFTPTTAGTVAGQSSANASPPMLVIKKYDDAGRVTSIVDKSTEISTTYSYYLTGQVYQETIVNTSGDSATLRNYHYSYDADGRMTRWADSVTGANLNTKYDNDGNVQWVYTDVGYDPTGANTAHYAGYQYVNDYYQYDAGDRLQSETDESVDTSGSSPNAVINAYTYDAANQRATWTDGSSDTVASNGAPMEWTYSYDANGRVVQATASNQQTETRSWIYDARGNILTYQQQTVSGPTATVDYSLTSIYNVADRETQSITHSNSVTNQQPDLTTTTVYDKSLRIKNVETLSGQSGQAGYTDTKYAYTYYNDGREKSVTSSGSVINSSGGSQSINPTSAVYTYDADKNVVKVDLGQGSGMTSHETKTFITDNEGHILYLDHVTGTGSADDKLNYFYANGNPVGEVGQKSGGLLGALAGGGAAPALKVAVFDSGSYSLVNNITPDQPDTPDTSSPWSYDATRPGEVWDYTVQSGDTLQSIASEVYGNPSLWYVIADANGLDPNATLKPGTLLIVPSNVQSGAITDATHAVYNQADIVGNNLPNLQVSPPAGPSDCAQIVGIIIAVIVAIAVAVATYGVGSALSGAIIGAAGVAADSAAGVGITLGTFALTGAAIAGVADIGQQELYKAIGYPNPDKQSFWQQVENSAIMGGISGLGAGVGAAGNTLAAAGDLTGLEEAGFQLSDAAIAVSGSAVQQELDYGQITNWVGIAAAGIGAYAATSNLLAAGDATYGKGLGMAGEGLVGEANNAAAMAEQIGEINKYLSPWMSFTETQIRDDQSSNHNQPGLPDFVGALSSNVASVLMDDLPANQRLQASADTGGQHYEPGIGLVDSNGNLTTLPGEGSWGSDYGMSQVTMTRSGDGLSWGTDYDTPTITPSDNSDMAAWGNYGADQRAAESAAYLAQETPINTGQGLLSDSNDPIARRAAELRANDPTLSWTDAMDQSNAEAQTNAAAAAKQYQNAGITVDEPAPDSVVGSNLPTTGIGYLQVSTPATAGSVAEHFAGSAFTTLLNSVSNGIADLYRIPNDLGNAADYIQADLEANVANAWQTGDWTHYQIGLTQAPIPQLTSSIAQAADQGVSLSDALANAIPGYSIANNLADAGTALSNGDYNGAADELGKGVGGVASLLVMEKAVNAGVFLAEGLGGVINSIGAPQLPENVPTQVSYNGNVVDNSTPAIEGVLEGTSPSAASSSYVNVPDAEFTDVSPTSESNWRQPTMSDIGIQQQQSNMSGGGSGDVSNAFDSPVVTYNDGIKVIDRGGEGSQRVGVIRVAEDGSVDIVHALRSPDDHVRTHALLANATWYSEEPLTSTSSDRLLGFVQPDVNGPTFVRESAVNMLPGLEEIRMPPTENDIPVIRAALRAARLDSNPSLLRVVDPTGRASWAEIPASAPIGLLPENAESSGPPIPPMESGGGGGGSMPDPFIETGMEAWERNSLMDPVQRMQQRLEAPPLIAYASSGGGGGGGRIGRALKDLYDQWNGSRQETLAPSAEPLYSDDYFMNPEARRVESGNVPGPTELAMPANLEFVDLRTKGVKIQWVTDFTRPNGSVEHISDMRSPMIGVYPSHFALINYDNSQLEPHFVAQDPGLKELGFTAWNMLHTLMKVSIELGKNWKQQEVNYPAFIPRSPANVFGRKETSASRALQYLVSGGYPQTGVLGQNFAGPYLTVVKNLRRLDPETQSIFLPSSWSYLTESRRLQVPREVWDYADQNARDVFAARITPDQLDDPSLDKTEQMALNQLYNEKIVPLQRESIFMAPGSNVLKNYYGFDRLGDEGFFFGPSKIIGTIWRSSAYPTLTWK